jgi:hypothetical protein
VEAIKAMNDGSPVKQERITVDAKGVLTKLLDLRENDVFLVRLIRS